MSKDLMGQPAFSISEARRRFAEICKEAAYGRRIIILTRRGKPVAAIMGIDELEHFRKLEDEHYARTIEQAIATSPGTVSAIKMFEPGSNDSDR